MGVPANLNGNPEDYSNGSDYIGPGKYTFKVHETHEGYTKKGHKMWRLVFRVVGDGLMGQVSKFFFYEQDGTDNFDGRSLEAIQSMAACSPDFPADITDISDLHGCHVGIVCVEQKSNPQYLEAESFFKVEKPEGAEETVSDGDDGDMIPF